MLYLRICIYLGINYLLGTHSWPNVNSPKIAAYNRSILSHCPDIIILLTA